jgi:hypothetical protein
MTKRDRSDSEDSYVTEGYEEEEFWNPSDTSDEEEEEEEVVPKGCPMDVDSEGTPGQPGYWTRS